MRSLLAAENHEKKTKENWRPIFCCAWGQVLQYDSGWSRLGVVEGSRKRIV